MSDHEAATLDDLLAFCSKHKSTVVDFYAEWCGPCKRIAPYLHTATNKEGVALVKVNVDVNQDASAKYGIQAMPTFKVLDRFGNEIYTKTGGSEAVVNDVIAKAKAHQ